MGEITRVGVDLAKRVIQVHAVDDTGRVIAAKQLQRDGFTAWCAQLPPGCVVAMRRPVASVEGTRPPLGSVSQSAHTGSSPG